MLKKLWLFMLLSVSAMAQSYTIVGTLVDTSQAPLEFATVFLLHPTDSTMLTFGRTDDKGKFEFKNVRKGDVVFQGTYIGFLPFKMHVSYNPQVLNLDLGNLVLKPIDKELYEVVVKTAKAPMAFKGDTVEYDASKFKVPPGSTVEDLLKQLPGFQVDNEGSIKAQGENVTKVLVGGKRFFGSDPKLATRNLPSEAVSKVQVFNDATEQSKLTGVKDGKTEKTINLELKDQYKKGKFGKVSAGYGTEDRVIGKGNFNKFDEKNQLSLVGFGNNLSQSGLSYEDYQDFQGSNAYSWGENVDFGFNTGTIIVFGGGGDNSDVSTGIPISFGSEGGLSKNYAGGINYNYDTPKNKLTSNYFFNKTQQQLQQEVFKEVFLQGNSYTQQARNLYENTIGNHRAGFRFDRQLDSLRNLLIYADGRIADRNSLSDQSNRLFNTDLENFRNTRPYSEGNALSKTLQTSAVFKNNFKKAGRRFLWSGTYGITDVNNDAIQRSDIEEIIVGGDNFPIDNIDQLRINQLVLGRTKSNTYKSSAMFVEPLNKFFSWNIFGNLSHMTQTIDRNVFTPPNESVGNKNDLLSVYYDNQINYNRVGSSINYNRKGVFGMVGLARQGISLEGEVSNNNERTLIDNRFKSLLPIASTRLSLGTTSNLSVNYSVNETAPTFTQLQPYIDNSNPMYITTGNPNLKPTRSQIIDAYYSYYDRATFMSIWLFTYTTFYNNRIIYNRTIGEDLVTYTSPSNIKDGGYSTNSNLNVNFPIRKNKLTAGVSISGGVSEMPLYINDQLNINNSKNYSYGLNFRFTPASWLVWSLDASNYKNFTKYSIFISQNQTYTRQYLRNTLNVQFPKYVFFTSSLNYSHQKNDRIGLDRHIPILTFNVYKVLGKKQQHEIRLTANDVFNKNLSVSQSASSNEVSFTNANTLSRYFMLTYAFNMRGLKTKL